ncbi:amino acid adenylation domain-containing protein [Nostoc sp. UCD121]|uniref:non-ribosomal peptide synthetase n=1 Tax=unclassified Nostoc TaxID=2593658 RepID=UPI001625E9FF|nr:MULTISPECIES: non-ribosomal peptide synthetase [unclassified Nostoc]MBC1224761.1 amino acid adenylation domain-containing protein [Nostoc sp. UCD120]MBC1276250.1 amino acid adenylation domain-containing protein [Nostoc sp. UCD121]MBC1294947.1 amino acid adenylation domain-containing protein [Nostoc sp. UCD122]
MTTTNILTEISKLGVQVWVDGEQLRYRSPKGALTPTLRAYFAEHKAEILTLLRQSNNQDSVSSVSPSIVYAPDEQYLPFPLNDMQQAYWLGQSDSFELGNVAAHYYTEFEFVDFNLEKFNLAWQRLIKRHSMLRAIVLPDGQQKILEQVPPLEIEVRDLRGQKTLFVESVLESVRQQMSHQGPSTDRWPLFKVLAHQLDNQQVRLHFNFSLLIIDGWSFNILLQELAALYQNPDYSLPPLDISYRDYTLALGALQNSEIYRKSQNYWWNRLTTLPPAPEIPLAKHPSTVTHPQFVHRKAILEPETWLKLKNRASEENLTPTSVLCAAYAEVLTIWSKEPIFSINLMLYNRRPLHPQVKDILGSFVNTNLLEVDNSLQDSFVSRVQRLQKQLWDDLENSYVSGVRVLRELNRTHGGTLKATMPVVFASGLNLREEQAASTEWVSKVIYTCVQTPQVWLDHQVVEKGGALVLIWDALEEIFPPGLLDNMFSTYCSFLHRLADEKDAWQKTARQLMQLARLEQQTDVNITQAPIPTGMLHTLFATQVALRSQQSAVISSHRTLTYEQLSSRSNQVGRCLQQLGTRANVLVAVVMEKGWEQVVAVLGVLQSGAAYLPIDPALPKERLWYLIGQSEVGLVLTQSWLDKKLEWPDGIQRLCVDSADLEKIDDRPLKPVQKPEDLAYVIFTSGSTGLPKGVMIDHCGAVNTIYDINHRFGVGPEDRVLAISSLSFDLSVYDIFGTLAAGGTIVIPQAEAVRDPAHWAELLVREKVTIWNSVPALMQMLVEYADGRLEKIPSNLRLVLLSGDWIPVSLPNQITSLVPGIQVISLGGATEASIWSILYPIEDIDPAWKSIPYGRPMLNQSFYVLNEMLEACPVWVTGELYIGGRGVAKGYWQDEEKTRARFIKHPQTGEYLYQTGDLGRYLSDGNIEFLGREDFQVKVQGHRIELGEIETALEQHPAVRAVVVTALGEFQDSKRLVAYVVSIPDTALDVNQLRGFLEGKLPEYMMPSAFILLDTLPLTFNGKVDRKALPTPEANSSEREKAFVSPRNTLEFQLAQIWEDLLDKRAISVNDNFFDLGGHSLLAVRLMTQIQKLFGRELSLSTLLQAPTIEDLASRLNQQTAPETQSPLVKIHPAGSKRPLFFVHPVGGNVLCYLDLARHLGPEQPFYGLEAAGIQGETKPFKQIQDMATYYIDAIRDIQPEGPYLLAGWSMGGFVAFEMAQQLHKQCQEVALLALLDSRVPVNKVKVDDATLMAWFVKDLGGRFGKTLTLSPKEIRRLRPDEQLDYVLEQARTINLVPPDVGLTQIQRLLEVFKANMESMLNYKPQVYGNQVTLIRPSESFSDDFEYPISEFGLGWEKFVSGLIEIHTVPGDHYTMLAKPHVYTLAEQLKCCLDKLAR